MIRIGIGISIFFILIMAGVSAYGWATIPAETMIARHWSLSGEANGFSPRNHVLIGAPLLGLFFAILFAAIPKIDPRADHVRQSGGILMTGWIGTLAILTIMHGAIIVQAASGKETLPVPGLTLYALSLFMILLGNFTAKSRSNFFLGVRTPWTLSSEHAWSVANRTAGWLFVATGLAAAASGLVTDPTLGYRMLLAGVIAAALISVVISYFAWKNDPERRGA